MPLRVTSGKLDIQPRSISCHLYDGVRNISCTIAIEVVLDLADHHLLNWSTALEAFGLLIPEIERLANRKYQFGLQENVEILIGGTDLMRYGFSRLDKSETIEASVSWPMAAE